MQLLTPLAARVRKRQCSLGLWNTAGQEDYDRLRPLSYPQTDVFLVFARVGDKSTYESVEQKWIPEIKYHCPDTPFIIVGISVGDNEELPQRVGLPRSNDHYTRLGLDLAKRFQAVTYVECDILTNYRLHELFEQVSTRQKSCWSKRC
jgi:Ras-related C3 botulinum toxin substrate 1